MARVLLVGKGEPERGGIPSFLRAVLTSDLARLHDLQFLNLTRPGEPQGGRLTIANFHRTVTDAVAVWRAAADADVVHVHSAVAPAVTAVRCGLLLAAARARGASAVLHAHGGLLGLWLDRPWKRLLVRAALAPAQRVVAVSGAVHARLQAVLGPARVHLMDNGVDVETFLPARRAHAVPRVLFVGLLTPRKGLLDLFDASRLLAARGVEHELLVVGGTPDEGSAAEQSVRAGVPATARLLGPRDAAAMPSVYADADLFCLPSWWEAMPLSLLEAMASGLPVVATDVGDVMRVVGDKAGVVVPPRRPDQLAAALEKLLVDADLRRAMGAAGRERVRQHFGSRSMASALDRTYRELEAVR